MNSFERSPKFESAESEPGVESKKTPGPEGQEGAEAERIFETKRLEFALDEKTKEWSQRVEQDIDSRAGSLGLSKDQVLRCKESLQYSLLSARLDLSNEEFVAQEKDKLLKEIQETIKSDSSRKERLEGLIHQYLEPIPLLDLMIRKFDGEITRDETELLGFMEETRGFKGASKHNALGGRFTTIELGIINSKSPEEMRASVMHELTHVGLANAVPKDKFELLLNATQKNKELRLIKDPYAAEVMHQLLQTTNESLAFVAENFYLQRPYLPLFEEYKKHYGISPKIFEQVFVETWQLKKSRTIKEFDGLAIKLYKMVIEHLDAKMTEKDADDVLARFFKVVEKKKAVMGTQYRQKGH